MPNGHEPNPAQAELLRLLEERRQGEEVEREALRGLSGRELNPAQQELQRLLRGRQQAHVTPDTAPDDRGFFEKAGEFGKNLALTFDRMRPTTLFGGGDPQSLASTSLVGAGAVSEGILSPLEALLQLPGLTTDRNIVTDQAADFVSRARQGLYSVGESNALATGMSHEEIQTAYGLGNFIGFIAPLAAALKGARLVMGVKGLASLGDDVAQNLMASKGTFTRLALGGNIVTDAVAGAIYGGVLTPSDSIGDRLKHARNEAAIFGVARTILNTFSFPYFAWRRVKLDQFRATERVQKLLKDLENGKSVVIGAEESPMMMELMSQEGYISSSWRAQILIERGLDDAAIVQAVKDVAAKEGGSAGVVRGIGSDFGEVSAKLDRFREQFPGLKFDVVKSQRPRRVDVVGEEGLTTAEAQTFDIYFGVKGLSNTQRKAFAKHGRFPGQQLYHEGGATYQYLKPASREGWLAVKTEDGTVTQIKADRVTELPSILEDTAEDWMSPLFENFWQSLDDQIREYTASSGAMSEVELIRAIREGRLTLTDDAKRAFDAAGAIVHPEELGLGIARDNMSSIVLRRVTQGGIPQEGMINRVMARDGSTEWRLMQPKQGGEFGLEEVARFRSIEEAAAAAEKAGWAGVEVRRFVPTAEGAMREISETGTEFVGVLPRPQAVTFEDMVEKYLVNEGIDIGTRDFEAAKNFFGQQARRRMWNEVPAADRKVFENVRKEFHRLIDENDIPFEALAHSKGFSVERLAEGRIRMRDINTGARLQYGSERVARSALKDIKRTDGGNIFGGTVPMGTNGLGIFTGGWDPTDGVFRFSKEVDWKTLLDKDSLPFAGLRNTRDWLIKIEDMTGIPIWSRGFDEISVGLDRARREIAPWAKEIQRTWKGVSDESKDRIVNFWIDVEGQEIPIKEAVALARERGLTQAEINTWKRATSIFQELFRLSGIERARYISHYYSRVRPQVLRDKQFIPERAFDGVIPPDYQGWWARMTRTGDMAIIDKDPAKVMHKYVRSMFWDQHVAESWSNIAKVVGTRKRPQGMLISDLPEEMQASILKNAPRGTSRDSPILSKPIRTTLHEYLNITRGTPGSSLESLREFNTRLFRRLGMDVDPRVLEEYHNSAISTMYGAAMGARPKLVARNSTQTMWTLYTRLGGKYGGASLETAISQAGMDAAMDAGALRMVEAGVPYGDAIFQDMIQSGAVQGGGLTMAPVRAAMRFGLRYGYVSRRFARKLLVPYSSTDQMNRAWAFHWQRMHTAEHLSKYENFKIGWERFAEEGLPMFKGPTKEKFRDIYKAEGREAALDFIGRQGSDEAHFIYGLGAQPAWMQKWWGRFLGMFGTWPLWAGELYLSRVRHGTRKQQAAFVARNLAVAGTISNMAIETGRDIWDWMAPSSIMYGGGPGLDYIMQFKQVVDAPLDQKASALRRLGSTMGRLALPGQTFVFHEIPEAMGESDFPEAVMRLFLGRKTPPELGSYYTTYVADPEADPFKTEFYFPDTIDGIEERIRGSEKIPMGVEDLLEETSPQRRESTSIRIRESGPRNN